MKSDEISRRLIDKGLKVTPQRITIFEAVIILSNHPTADQVLDYIRKKNPNISPATIYKVLSVLVENGLIKTVKSDKDIMRYDAILEKHHHIYFPDSDNIADYIDEELDVMLEKYFEKKEIPGLKIADIRLQIIGESAGKVKK